MATEEKPVMVIGIDDSEHSTYALQWTLDHFFSSPNPSFKLIIIHARPNASSFIGLSGPGAGAVYPQVVSDLKRVAARVVERAKELCTQKSINDVRFEVKEGDARSILCAAVDEHGASILAVGSHGYGAIKRAIMGSVSDHCAHHAHCTVMIVKNPKIKRGCI